MKRYLVFTFDHYYPRGGWSDLAASFNDKEDALSFARLKNAYYDEVQVIDIETLEEVDWEEAQ